MTCDQTQLLLDAYADHALSAWQAYRVRRHLAGCAVCTAQLADIQRLSASVHVWRDTSAPVALQGRIAAALPMIALTPPRDRRIVRRTAVGLAGVAAIIVGFWLLPGHPAQPTFAYADVERAMASVNVMAWTGETTIYGKHGVITQHHVAHIWMRRNPLAVATVTLPEPSQPRGSQTLEDERGHLDILPNGKCVVLPGRTTVFGTVAAYTSLFTRPLRMLEGGKLGEQGRSGELEQTTLNSKPALKVTLSWHIPNELRTTLWIDPVTKHVIQMEARSTANGASVYTDSDTQMRYDEIPPLGVFDVVPLPGARAIDQRTLRVYRQK